MLRIYKSSAGSGKTYTLVREYLRIALRGEADKYRHILAITFTNKAANEMKERVISALGGLAKQSEKTKSLSADLTAALSIPAEELSKRAQALLLDILHNYSDFSISTIDSFVHRLIRSFAYDLRISSNFEIEMDSTELLTKAVEKLLDKVNDEGTSQITKALIDFAENNLNEGKGWNLEYSLINFSQELFNEEAYEFVDRLSGFSLEDFAKVRDRLYAVKAAYETKLSDPAKAAIELIHGSGLDESHFYQSRASIYKYLLNIAGDAATAKLEPNSYVQKTIHEDKWTSGKITASDKAKLESIKAQITQYYEEIQDSRQNESDYILAKLLLKNIYSFMLLTEIKRMLEEYKEDNNLLHISEFQKRISRIVNEQDAPIIYERIGDWYDSVLIDEFQDTSVLQWHNLLPLIENSQMKVEDSLIVGDGKQAIYRFRGGEVEQFAALPQVYKSDGNYMLQAREVAIMNYGVEELSLNKNYRSRKGIIDFNNQFYDVAAAQPEFGHQHIYTGHAQLSGREVEGGMVSIDFLHCAEDEGEYAAKLCAHVEALVHTVRDRGYSWSDIAVLTRTNVIGSEIAAYMLQQGIPVVSSESLLINSSFEVRATISFLYYLSDKDNLIRRAEVLYYTAPDQMSRDGQTVHARLRGSYMDFEQYISELTGISFDSDTLVQNRLPELIQALFRAFPFLNKEDSFTQFFQDEVLEYSVRNGNRITEFLTWWEANKHRKSIIYPESMDAVRVLTIHKAKGLQYPVVIIPDADFKLRNTKKYLWSELTEDFVENVNVFPLPVQADLQATAYGHLYTKEMSDSLLDLVNLFYVATTRPEEMLYIISEQPDNEPERLNSVTALLVRFLRQTGLWDGFKEYIFGDADTHKEKIGTKKVVNEFIYSGVINTRAKHLQIRLSDETLLINESKAIS
ncbi:MAG: UvrD-helicase domain-containing protein [Bacteroidetes bacterium]|nr:UvrD-helicase domain-containing protein [Bacteroidota bacterium]